MAYVVIDPEQMPQERIDAYSREWTFGRNRFFPADARYTTKTLQHMGRSVVFISPEGRYVPSNGEHLPAIFDVTTVPTKYAHLEDSVSRTFKTMCLEPAQVGKKKSWLPFLPGARGLHRIRARSIPSDNERTGRVAFAVCAVYFDPRNVTLVCDALEIFSAPTPPPLWSFEFGEFPRVSLAHMGTTVTEEHRLYVLEGVLARRSKKQPSDWRALLVSYPVPTSDDPFLPFMKRFDGRVWMAGGWVAAKMTRTSVSETSDVDVFFTGTRAEVESDMRDVKAFWEATGTVAAVWTSGFTETLVRPWPLPNVQLVTLVFPNPAAMLLGFDLGSCKFMTNGATAWTTPLGRYADLHHRNIVIDVFLGAKAKERVQKYAARGFKPLILPTTYGGARLKLDDAFVVRKPQTVTEFMHLEVFQGGNYGGAVGAAPVLISTAEKALEEIGWAVRARNSPNVEPAIVWMYAPESWEAKAVLRAKVARALWAYVADHPSTNKCRKRVLSEI